MFTPTEAAVVAVIYAIIVGMFIYCEISFRFLLRSLVRTGVTSGIVMLLIGCANIFAWLMTVSGVPAALAGAIQAIGGGKVVFLAMHESRAADKGRTQVGEAEGAPVPVTGWPPPQPNTEPN